MVWCHFNEISQSLVVGSAQRIDAFASTNLVKELAKKNFEKKTSKNTKQQVHILLIFWLLGVYAWVGVWY